jgi:cyclopropane-fatty-acyl-phospholipid synthase
MIEAVDWREYDAFFATCSRLVRPGGQIALQAIVIDEALYEYRKRRRDFVKARIFPGGCLPSTRALVHAAERSAALRFRGVLDIGEHYADTLAAWRERLLANGTRLRALGFDGRFERLWVFYLAMCEAGFRERHLGDVQLSWRRI